MIGYEKGGENIDIIFFEGKLHVLLIIIIVEILSPIVHGEVFQHAYLRVERPVFLKMLEQFGQFDQLYHVGGLTNKH